jgi:Transposase protein
MGYGATRSLERVAAAMGALEAAPIVFEAARDIPQGGVLLALPALLAVGLLRHSTELYALPKGFYGLSSVLVLLALMALARIGSIEQLRYAAAGEWGNLLGLDRVPEVRTLREKLKLLCIEQGRAARWNAALAKEWIGQHETEQYSGLAFYIDGHVRVYHGELTKLPRHYVPRERFYLRATMDYWVNALDGQPFFYVNKEVDHGLVQAMREDVLPWLEANAPTSAEHKERMAADPRAPRFTVIFDREGYSPDLFLELQQQRIAALTYHRYPEGEDWRAEEFQEQAVKLVSGQAVRMKLAERGTHVGKRPGLWVREVRKLGADGHQVSIVSTNFSGDAASQAVALMARWSQENFFKYMREHFGLDALVQYGTEEIPATVTVINPAWRELDGEIRKKHAELKSLQKLQQNVGLIQPLSEAVVRHYEQHQGELQERIEQLQPALDQLKQRRKQTPRQIPVQDLPEPDRFTRLRTERKYFLDTIKMIAYRAETSMASTVREKLKRSDDARALLRQIYNTEVDLIPDLNAKTLTVCLHHLTQAAHDATVRYLCEELTATEITFPGTDLRLVYKLGSA